MQHNLACRLKNQMSALENWRDDKGRMPSTQADEIEILNWAREYRSWN